MLTWIIKISENAVNEIKNTFKLHMPKIWKSELGS